MRLDRALDGDDLSAEEVLRTYLQRPRMEPPQPPDGFKLPEITDGKSAGEAMRALAIAASQGADPLWVASVRESIKAHQEQTALADLEAEVRELKKETR